MNHHDRRTTLSSPADPDGRVWRVLRRGGVVEEPPPPHVWAAVRQAVQDARLLPLLGRWLRW